MTVRDLIRYALLDLQVLAAGEAPTAAEAQDSLAILNSLVDSWNLQGLLVYVIDRSVQTLIPGQAVYTVGSGGQFNIARPHHFDAVAWRDTATGLELPMEALTDNDFQSITLRATASTIPRYFYYNLAYPLATITVYPVPSVGNEVILYPWHQISTFASLETVIVLPPGYERALRSNLALELAPSFAAEPSAMLLGVAAESKATLQMQNVRVERLAVDAALVHTGGQWDYRTGGFVGGRV